MRDVTGLSPVSSTVSDSSDGTDSNYQCDACSAAFDTEDELRKHLHEQGLVD